MHHQHEPTRLRMADAEDRRAKLGTPAVRGGHLPDPIYPIVFDTAFRGYGEPLHSIGGITVREIAAVQVTTVQRYIAAQVEQRW